jgi:L-iditol 2-dehydrogenase
VPQRILYPLPDKVSFEQAAMVEPLSVAVHAVELTPISLNDTAIVVGAGTIGLLVIQALRVAGCGRIIAVDIDRRKLELARKLGADEAFHATEIDVPAAVLGLTDQRGADVGIEVVGNSSTFHTAISSLRKGGALTLIGNLVPQLDFPLQVAVTRQICVQGSCASNGEYPACLDLISTGRIHVDALISKVAPLAEGAVWFNKLYNKEDDLMKVILTP